MAGIGAVRLGDWAGVARRRGVFQYNGTEQAREATIQREIELSRQVAGYQKPKHKLKNDLLDEDVPVRLTRDGEFSDSFVQEIEASKRARQ